MIDAAAIRALLEYDATTGAFTWRERERRWFTSDGQFRNWNGRYPGQRAGRVNERGYRIIGICDRLYPAHRLAWLYVTGEWPRHQIDHINGQRDDNRFENLRDVTNAENGKNRRTPKNNPTGRVGVSPYFFRGQQKYVARIRAEGKLHHLGYFDTVEDAAAARSEAERSLGFHANHGSKPVWPGPLRKMQSRPFPSSRREQG